ncbi:MAG TPA: DUF6338 family protein [Flavisolibacter sp.]|nr:DUF6338 family protein [Flavisolibacter sp.]
MDAAVVSLQDVANIVSFIAPGYFAIQVYSLVYAKRDRDFPKLLIESVIFSLPIVTLSNVIWEKVLDRPAVTSLSIKYAILLLAIAILSGIAATMLRKRWPLKDLALMLGLGSPNGDFVKTQLERVDVNNPDASSVTVSLKNGSIFSGTSDRISRYSHDGPLYYCFANLAWFNSDTGKWEEQGGSIIVERNEIDYIVTPKLKDDESKARILPKRNSKKKQHDEADD